MNIKTSSCCILIYMFMQDTNWRKELQTQEDFFSKIYLSLYLYGFEKVIQGLRVRGSWRPNRNCNILTLTLMGVTLCLSCSHDAKPEVQRPTLLGDGFLYCILSATSLVPKLHRGSRGPPSAGCGFPYHISFHSDWNLNWPLTSVLTAIYNNSTPTRSPTRSLKSNV